MIRERKRKGTKEASLTPNNNETHSHTDEGKTWYKSWLNFTHVIHVWYFVKTLFSPRIFAPFYIQQLLEGAGGRANGTIYSDFCFCCDRFFRRLFLFVLLLTASLFFSSPSSSLVGFSFKAEKKLDWLTPPSLFLEKGREMSTDKKNCTNKRGRRTVQESRKKRGQINSSFKHAQMNSTKFK